jgi:hypothetical protein
MVSSICNERDHAPSELLSLWENKNRTQQMKVILDEQFSVPFLIETSVLSPNGESLSMSGLQIWLWRE